MSAEEKVLQRVFGGEELQHAQVALFESFYVFLLMLLLLEKNTLSPNSVGEPQPADCFFLSLMKSGETSHGAWLEDVVLLFDL